MKKAIKFGFGFAFGAYLFQLCSGVVNNVSKKHFVKKFNEDEEFRVKTMSPEMYAKHLKDIKGNMKKNHKDCKACID